MKRLLVLGFLVLAAGCSKTVSRSADSFGQINEPDPSPTDTPVPTPSGTPNPVPTGPVTCSLNSLGDLVDFEAYVNGDLKFDQVTIDQRAAAEDVGAIRSEFGGGLSSSSIRADLASVVTLSLDHVKARHGRITYGKTLDFHDHVSALGGIVKAPFDLATGFRRIEGFSSVCMSEPSNVKIKRTCRHEFTLSELGTVFGIERCKVALVGISPTMNVAELTDADLLNTSTFIIDIPKGASLVINLSESRSASFRGVKVKFSSRAENNSGDDVSLEKGRVFWNLPAADSLEFTGTGFRGMVVAPGARTKVAGQDGRAGFWVRELASVESNW